MINQLLIYLDKTAKLSYMFFKIEKTIINISTIIVNIGPLTSNPYVSN
jgi:hypothetical protein